MQGHGAGVGGFNVTPNVNKSVRTHVVEEEYQFGFSKYVPNRAELMVTTAYRQHLNAHRIGMRMNAFCSELRLHAGTFLHNAGCCIEIRPLAGVPSRSCSTPDATAKGLRNQKVTVD
ncbi:hypothetical protein EVAR_54043_1 [Eumeta japonica]|uniref:Uncharacterized protein n=1 Tax=Eumeta variegata TaxID=151549 RepID=A0A4C1YNZ7_EUMVA|nr:hypothetical protein EVAR_54043_1 [Eumeta japonica]